MENKLEQKKGITLIALVITIIVLLILAGISIATLTGQNGVLTKANTAKEENQKAEYKEVLELIGNGIRPEKILENLSVEEFMNKYKEKIEEEIKKEQTLKGAAVENANETTLWVTTKEGYVYKITENEVKFLGNPDRNLPNEASITFDKTSVTEGEDVIATVTQSDETSGVDIKNCRYVFTTSNKEIGTTDVSKYTGGTFTKENEDKITLNCTQSGTYYLHVLTVDNFGNKRETISLQGVVVKVAPLHIVKDGVANPELEVTIAGEVTVSYPANEGYVLLEPTDSARGYTTSGISWYVGDGSKYSTATCVITTSGRAYNSPGLNFRAGTSPITSVNKDSEYPNNKYGSYRAICK